MHILCGGELTSQDWFRLLSDPNPTQLERMLSVGQKVTWPALSMVKNRLGIEVSEIRRFCSCTELTVQRAILRGRTEIRSAMRRDRTTTDRGAASPRRPEAGNQSDSQVPIESDADAGFASRSRRLKMTKDRGLTAREIFGDINDPSRSVRRRKPFRTTGQGQHPATEIAVNTTAPDNDRATHTFPRQNSQDSPSKGYAASLSDAFRHVRASSLSAFGGQSGRTVRFGTDQEIGQASSRPKSSLSITKWFGGASESSSESESDGEMGLNGSGSGPSGDEMIPTFRLPTDDQVVVDDDEDEDSDSEGEGEIPIPGGERVSQETIDASVASGTRVRSVRPDSPETIGNSR